ncbi:multicopper oxidase family protein [Bradyrhizobium diazoefficiens]|uniref:multicopper oxidase family protein n=1 Tax=Bradyrhizobium diazoefficiens TaxID=1355477 RepID=UPI00190CC9E3|nr:multicopper oxidase family protein [Bradyrhizobium diazoefficiens]QQO36280.1 multicopper oxidase family protein [Bradyrhizobium diazoefficiens]
MTESEKTTLLTRRRIFASAVAIAGAIRLAPVTRAVAAPERRAADLRLTAETRILSVNGKPAQVFGLNGPKGKPGIALLPGERFRVDLLNRAGAATIIHWHGQLPPWKQDGFPWPQTPPIPAGDTHAYDYAPITGTYWMHSHHGMQEQRLMSAPLIVHSPEDLRADRQEVVLMLHDFSFRTPEELLAGLTNPSATEKSGMRSSMNMGFRMGALNTSSGMSAVGMGSGMKMDLNDIDYDAFLANDRTLADPQVIRTEPGGRVLLRLINGACSTEFWIDLGGLTGTVIAADGHPVRPVRGTRLPLAIAQRLDVIIDLPGKGAYPILAQVEGKRARTGIILAASGAPVSRLATEAAEYAPPVDLSLEHRLEAVTPLAPRAPDVTYRVILAGGMSPYAWSMNGQFWPDVTPLMVTTGQRVVIEMMNASMMEHPMHLHGHAFQVISLNGTPVAGAVRDTVLVPPMGSVTIAFDANNPGRWAFHCHNLHHMMTGMMTELRYSGII